VSDMHFESFGSQQQRLFRRGIRDGLPIDVAAARANCDIDTARLIAADDLKNPPPPEAYELLYDPDAPAAASSTQAKEATMAKADEETGEYKRPDAQKAIQIFDKQIKPKLTNIATLKGDLSEPWGDLKEHARISKKDFNYVQSLVDEEDEAKRDHRLLSLKSLLEARGLRAPRDLVTMAEGTDGEDLVGIEEREDGELLVDQDEEEAADDFTEATTEELAAQEDRGRKRKPRAASISQIAPLASVPEVRAH